jgi:addiction module HigA family antidote
MAKKLPPLHPGEVLREEFLVPLDISAGALATACCVPQVRFERLSNEQTAVSADTALRLSKAFGTTPEFWLNLQNSFDLETAKTKIAGELDSIKLLDQKHIGDVRCKADDAIRAAKTVARHERDDV